MMRITSVTGVVSHKRNGYESNSPEIFLATIIDTLNVIRRDYVTWLPKSKMTIKKVCSLTAF